MKISIFVEQKGLSIAAVSLLVVLFACSPAPAHTAIPAPAFTAAATDIPTATITPLPTASMQPGATPTAEVPLTETAVVDRCIPAPAGLVGWWPGDGNARDLVTGNDGVLHGGADFAAGKVRQAFRFNGLDGSVDIPRAASLDLSRQVSIEFWMKPGADNTMSTCCQGLVGTDYYLIEISGGHTNNAGVNFVIHTGYQFHHTSDRNEAAFKVPPGEWSLVVGTYDGQRLRLYINGKEELQLDQPGRITPMLGDSFLSIGSEDGRTTCPECVGTRYFRGLIDEVSIYKRALDPQEIQSIFSAAGAGKCHPSP